MPKNDTVDDVQFQRLSASGRVLDDTLDGSIIQTSNSLTPLNDEDSKRVLNTYIDTARRIIMQRKSELQKTFESFRVENPIIIKEKPDFLINPNMEEKRKEVMKKIQQLLKRRYSLIDIANILETNDYDRLDEIIESKNRLYELLKKYFKEEKLGDINSFYPFNDNVGEKSSIYTTQEDKIKELINDISEGKYFKEGKESEDVISVKIDNDQFNMACKIEAEYLNNKYDKICEALEKTKRKELETLIDDLKSISEKLKKLSGAYALMDELMKPKTETKTESEPELKPEPEIKTKNNEEHQIDEHADEEKI